MALETTQTCAWAPGRLGLADSEHRYWPTSKRAWQQVAIFTRASCTYGPGALFSGCKEVRLLWATSKRKTDPASGLGRFCPR